MQRFVLFTIAVVMAAPYLAKTGVLPRPVKFLPELVSAIAILYVIVAGVGQRFRFVPIQYWFVFGLITIWIICGIVANSLGPGPIVTGVRTYLRAVPFFFLPAVFNFQDDQIRQQLRWLLGFGLLQVPFAIFQRYAVLARKGVTGDTVIGTTTASSTLSIFQISVVCILVGFLLKGRISKPLFVLLFIVLLIPTMINETKATLAFVPIALLVAFVVGSPPRKRLQVVFVTISLTATFIAAFIPIYDAMNVYSDRKSITSFFTEEGRLEQALSKDAQVGTTEYKSLGRGDALMVPLRYVAQDPVHFVFGLGIGNVSESALGTQFTGEYHAKFQRFTFTATAVFMLELGVLGTALIFVVYWMVFRDVLVVVRSANDIKNAIAIGWAGITAMLVLASFYKAIHMQEPLTYFYYYFSGLIATWRLREAHSSARTAPARSSSAPRTDANKSMAPPIAHRRH